MREMTVRFYPRAGTNAERVLKFILDNPGKSTNYLWNQLDMNPSVVRKCLGNLEKAGFIEDKKDLDNNHQWYAKGPVL
jgi:DNA-binding MarR family transcriptional regulator